VKGTFGLVKRSKKGLFVASVLKKSRKKFVSYSILDVFRVKKFKVCRVFKKRVFLRVKNKFVLKQKDFKRVEKLRRFKGIGVFDGFRQWRKIYLLWKGGRKVVRGRAKGYNLLVWSFLKRVWGLRSLLIERYKKALVFKLNRKKFRKGKGKKNKSALWLLYYRIKKRIIVC